MKARFEGGLELKTQYGIAKNLGTIFRRVTGIHLGMFPKDVPIDMFNSSCLTYEALRTYRTIVAEFECKRSRALLEAHRQSFRV